MPVRDIMREDVVTVTPDATAGDIAATMESEVVGSVVVLEGDRPAGVVTDRDLAIEVCLQGADPATTTAEDVMTRDLYTVTPEDGVYEALQGARDAGVRRIPVVESGTLAGIVTIDDFVVLLSGELGVVSEIVQGEMPSY